MENTRVSDLLHFQKSQDLMFKLIFLFTEEEIGLLHVLDEE